MRGPAYFESQLPIRNAVNGKAPGVRTACLYLMDRKTLRGAVYADDTLRTQTGATYGPGDGTVLARSASVPCQQWADMGEDVSLEPFHLGPTVGHRESLQAPEIIERVLELLRSRDSIR